LPAPGYAYLTLGKARAEVAARLEDPNYVYWTASELNDLIALAVRTWQALTGTYKQRATFDISPGNGVGGSAFYDLANLPVNNPQLPPVTLLSFFVTDQQLISIMLAALLEPPLNNGWKGTGQFSFPQITQALQDRINRWITDTGSNVTRNLQHVEVGPSASRIFLPEGVLDVRRAAWVVEQFIPLPPPSPPPPPPPRTVNLFSFGSAGTGGDDTQVFQTALNTTAKNGDTLSVSVSPQPYNVQPLFLPSGTSLLVASGVIIQATSGYVEGQKMINITDVANVSITATGATFQMRKAEYTTGEFRYCLNITGASNVVIQGGTWKNSGGDGIFIGGTAANNFSFNVTVQDATFDNHRRNAMSIISARSVFVRRCSFTNSNGTAPQDGIDLEPNDATEDLVDIHIEDSNCSGNAGDGMSIGIFNLRSSSQPVSITVLRHACSNNGLSGYIVDHQVDGTVAGVGGSILLQDCSSTMDKTYGAWAQFYSASGPSLTFQNLTVTNANQSRTTVNNAAVGIERDPSYGGIVKGTIGNVYFLNPTIRDTTSKIDYYYTINDYSGIGEVNIQFQTTQAQLSGARLATSTAWGWIDSVTATTVFIDPGPQPGLPAGTTMVTYTTLWRDDEYAMQAFRFPGSLTPAIPQVWGKFVMPPVGIDLYPPPINPGDLETLVVENGPLVGTTPAAVFASPTILRIPEDFVWGILFGALSDLLSADGPARDPARAVYAESRYQESVELYKMNPVLLQTQIEGVPVWTGSVFEMDVFLASWQTAPGVPQFSGMAGRNLVAFAPVPNATFNVTIDVVANIPVPAGNDTDILQIDRGTIGPLLDYVQHLASFKMAGQEFSATEKLRKNFYVAAALENARITKGSFYRRALEKPAFHQQFEVPRT
jgi:hypothetical protein